MRSRLGGRYRNRSEIKLLTPNLHDTMKHYKEWVSQDKYQQLAKALSDFSPDPCISINPANGVNDSQTFV